MFFGTKTLQSILAGFTKTVQDLEDFSAASRSSADTKRKDAEILAAEAEMLETDADKADKVRSNILSMLEV